MRHCWPFASSSNGVRRQGEDGARGPPFSAQSSAALARDVVALYKALGGGWNETDLAAGDAATRAP